jgi:hypothetical protein
MQNKHPHKNTWRNLITVYEEESIAYRTFLGENGKKVQGKVNNGKFTSKKILQ